MNKLRREELQGIIDRLEELKIMLEGLQEEEEEYRDSIPENMRGGEKYEKADTACDRLEDAIDNMEETIGNIEEATEV